MNYQLLGRSGLRVSDLCLGTMTFGEDWGWGAAKDEARKIYDTFRAAGGNFIDTANVYTNGTSEQFVGEFIAGHREEVVLATKYTNTPPGRGANAGGNHRKNMVESVEASLRRLKTDYIDLYWLHIWDEITPIEEVMRAFDDLVRAGKILYAGISDAPAWVVAKANTLADLRGWTRFVGLQIEYSLLERTVERELVPMAREEKLTVLAWSPLRNGVLTGKYTAKAGKKKAEGGRLNHEQMKGFISPDDIHHPAVAAVAAVAKAHGISSAQVALAWLRAQTVPVIPIIGARKLEQFEDNLRCLAVKLTQDDLERLDKASQVPLGFPYSMYRAEMVKNFVFGGLRNRIRT